MPTNDEDPPRDDRRQISEDVFALVANEIRVEIIQVLAEHGELSPSKLRELLDADVEPSQLHYHLQRLVGHFVSKTDAGYQLRPVGYRLWWTLRAGTFGRRQEQLSVDAGYDCHYCQAPMEARVDDGIVNVTCSDCECLYVKDFLEVPLETFEDETIAFLHFSTNIILKNRFVGRGVCPSCASLMDPEFRPPDETQSEIRRDVVVNWSCNHCGAIWEISVGMALLAAPELITFCHDHGVDVLSTPFWELEFAATDEHLTVRSTDPWEVALEVTLGGDTLELVVDGELNVLERNRLDASNQGDASLLRGIQCGVRLMGSMEKKDEGGLPDKQACLDYIRRHRWPDGVVCPHCDSPNTIKKGTTGKDAQRYRCQDCERMFNDLSGTLFADYGLSLPEMFYIIGELEATNAAQLARQLDRSYQTVLDFVYEVQDALADASDATMSSA